MPKKGLKRRVRRARPYKKRAMKVSQAVKQYVQRTIARKAETKSFYVSTVTNFGSTLAGTGPELNFKPILWYPLYHSLAQGVLDGQRVGNKVTIKAVYLKYVLNMLQYDAATNPNPLPVHVQLFLGRLKSDKSSIPVSADVAQLFNAGSATFGPAGNLTDLNATVNKDYWDMKKVWSHKLGCAEYAGTGSVANQQFFSNNDFKLNVVKRLNITRMLQKVAVWNDATNFVQNGNLFFGYQSLAANAGTTGAAVINTRIQYSIEIEYEDS